MTRGGAEVDVTRNWRAEFRVLISENADNIGRSILPSRIRELLIRISSRAFLVLPKKENFLICVYGFTDSVCRVLIA